MIGMTPGSAIRVFCGLTEPQVLEHAKSSEFGDRYIFSKEDLLKYADAILGIKQQRDMESHSSITSMERAQLAGQALYTFKVNMAQYNLSDPHRRDCSTEQYENNSIIAGIDRIIDTMLERPL